jgi:hypothetical protein
MVEVIRLHGISSSTGAGFFFVFKALQQAHSRLRNCCHNAEDGQKDKLVVEVISCTFLKLSVCYFLISSFHEGAGGVEKTLNETFAQR